MNSSYSRLRQAPWAVTVVTSVFLAIVGVGQSVPMPAGAQEDNESKVAAKEVVVTAPRLSAGEKTVTAIATSSPADTLRAGKLVTPERLVRPGLRNFYRVTDKLYRGAQPSAQGMRELQTLGIKTVINLRSLGSDRDELRGTQLRYEHIPCGTLHVEPKNLVRFLRVAADTNAQPVFVHCRRGADRTGTAVAVYRMAVQGWTKEQAIREMTHGGYGFDPLLQNLVRYVEGLDVGAIKREAGLATR